MEITETGANGNDLYATDEHWVCAFEDEVRRQLGVYAKVEDFYEATGDEQFESHPFVVDFELLPHDPSEDSPAVKGDDWIDDYADSPEHRAELKREAVQSYGGGAPVNRQLQGDAPEGVDAVADGYTGHPRFARREDATAYARAQIESKADAIMMLVGFVLDQPYNMLGDTGWDLIRPSILGE